MCKLYYPCVLIVIAPCTLIENWIRESQIIGFQLLNIDNMIKSKNTINITTDNNNIIISSWAKIPNIEMISKYFSNFIIVADEAHAMQNLNAQRTKSLLVLSKHQKCQGIVLSTGTPLKNGRPANLYPLLIAIRHSISFNKIEFEKRYCNAKKTIFSSWDINGCSNLEELRNKIGEYLIRKTKVIFIYYI